MSILGWIAAIVGGGVYMLAWRVTFAQWYEDWADEDWHWGTLVAGIVFSAACAPLFGPALWFSQASGSRSALKVGAVLAGARVEPEALHSRIRELERENARLERELEL